MQEGTVDRGKRRPGSGRAGKHARARRLTLLELVQLAQRRCGSEAQVVAWVTYLVNTGRVVLRGTFAGGTIK